MTDDDLVVGLEAIYQREYGRLVGLAALLVDDRSTAEEVVQDAFLALHRSMVASSSNGSSGIINPEGFLRRCVVNGGRDVQRRRVVRRRVVPDPVGPTQFRFAELDDVLARLPFRQRAALVLRYVEDLTERDRGSARCASKYSPDPRSSWARSAESRGGEMTDSNTGRGAISEPGLPDGYREHLLERRDRVVAEVVPPSLNDLVADRGATEPGGWPSGERPSNRGSRRPVRVLLAAAVVALVAGFGILFATAQRGRPVRVNTGGASNTTGSSVSSTSLTTADSLAGLPLLFPPSQTDKVAASLLVEASNDSSGMDIPTLTDVSSETFVAGKVGDKAQLITVISAPRTDSAKAFGVLRLLTPVTDWFVGSEPVRAKDLEHQILVEHPGVSIRVTVTDLPEGSVPLPGSMSAESPAVEVVVDELFGRHTTLRYVLLRGRSFDTIVLSNEVRGDVVHGVVDRLVSDGGRLRAGEVPVGFERLGQRSFWKFGSSGYATAAPSRLGYEYPISVSVETLGDAGESIAIAASGLPDATDPLVVLKAGPDWVLGSINLSIASGIREGAWVNVNDFTLRGFDGSHDGTWTSADVARLTDLWDGVLEVDRATFDAALAREADWDTVQLAAPDPAATGGSAATTTTMTTTLPGG